MTATTTALKGRILAITGRHSHRTRFVHIDGIADGSGFNRTPTLDDIAPKVLLFGRKARRTADGSFVTGDTFTVVVLNHDTFSIAL